MKGNRQGALSRLIASLDAIAARFALRRDETYLYLELLHEPLRLSRADGAAERQHGGVWMPAPFGAAMTAYDLLSNPNGFPVLAGQWCSHDSFNAVQAGTLQGQLKASVTPPAAQHFSGHVDRLRQAVARLGGTPTDGPGDFSAVLPVLPFFPVLLRFWEADDEFPAQLQFLWDRNSMRYLTYETSFYTHGAILDRLLEADM